MKVNLVNLRLSGSSDKLYSYIYNQDMVDTVMVLPGDRVVVPSKLKEDGTISLAIGTVVEVHLAVEPDPLIKYKHVVQFLNPGLVFLATKRLQEEAAAESNVGAQ